MRGSRATWLVVAIATASPAWAAPRTAVLSAPDDGEAAAALRAAIEPAALAAVPGARVPGASPASLAAVDASIAAAWRTFLAGDVAGARPQLVAALAAAVALAADAVATPRVAEAALRLGAVLAHEGDAEAVAHLRLARRLDPARAVTEAEFSPDVLAAVAAAVVAPTVAQALEVQAGAVGEVAVDGVVAAGGRAVVEVGLHLITARADGYLPVARLVSVDVAAPAVVTLTLTVDADGAALARGLRRGDDAVAVVDLLGAIGRRGEVDEVVLVAAVTRRRGPGVLGQRCVLAPAVRCTAVVELVAAAPGASAGVLGRALWPELRAAPLVALPGLLVDARLAPEPPPPPAPRCRACRSPWLWGSVGVAVAAGVIAALAFGEAAPPRAAVVIDPGAF